MNFQLHPRRRPSTPLNPEPQTPQVKLRNHGGKQEWKRGPSRGPAKNTQKEIIAPKTLLHRRRGRRRRSPTTSTTRRTRCAASTAVTATTSTSHTPTTLGRHMKKK